MTCAAKILPSFRAIGIEAEIVGRFWQGPFDSHVGRGHVGSHFLDFLAVHPHLASSGDEKTIACPGGHGDLGVKTKGFRNEAGLQFLTTLRFLCCLLFQTPEFELRDPISEDVVFPRAFEEFSGPSFDRRILNRITLRNANFQKAISAPP